MKWTHAREKPSQREGSKLPFVAAFLAAIVFAMPLGFAQETSANVAANATTVSSLDLRLKQIGQAFGDFVFNVRAVLTFDESAKVELLKERNAEIKERQQAWLELKGNVTEFSNLTAEEKRDIRGMIQAEHEAIIKEHLRLTSAIRDIQLNAKAHGNVELENEADEAAESGSGLSLGLIAIGHIDDEGEVDTSIDTAAEAQAIVEKDFGFTQSTVTTETRGDMTVYVVSGTETRTVGNYKLTKSFQVDIQAGTGTVLSADMSAHIVAITAVAVSTNTGVSAGSSASVSGSTGASSSAGASSGSASIGASGGVSAGASSNAGSGGSASATTAGGITIG